MADGVADASDASDAPEAPNAANIGWFATLAPFLVELVAKMSITRPDARVMF